MKKNNQFKFAILAFLILVSCATTKDNSIDNKPNSLIAGEVVSAPGIYQSPNGRNLAEISIDSLGGFANLSLKTKNELNIYEVRDVTGIAWVTDNLLIYSVSPIYGSPGIYSFDCTTIEIKRLMAPRTINAAYPNGADYFELYRLSNDRVFFYYAPDVDLVDFRVFRTAQHLFQVIYDGNGAIKGEPLQ